jgi:GT2 family glycosyltransferase
MNKKEIKYSEPSAVIIIVNFNNYDDTYECVKSIESINYNNYNIVVVDNASKEDPTARLKIEFPHVSFIRNNTNLGFTGGYNTGLQKAYEFNPKYIFLLNNDTIVSVNILSELVSFMEKNKNIGLVGPVNLYYDAKDTVCFAGGWLNRNTGIVDFLHKGDKFSDLDEAVVPCNFIEGSALFLRTELVKEIGGFNDLYFLTSEESELCINVADKGHGIAVLATCSVWHKVSRSMGSESQLATYFIFRNKLWFVKRNAIGLSLKDILILLRYYLVCLVSFSLKKGNMAAVRGLILGVYDFIRGVSGPGRFADTTQGRTKG